MISTTDADRVTADFVELVGPSDPVTIVGSQTRSVVNADQHGVGREVQAPAGIIAVNQAEMTVRVRTGTTVEELHRVLAEHGQRTALPERGGTVGGALAVGENSMYMLRRGAVRDALLQVRYVAADGQLVNAGGPTVKNVSGYNLARLMVGSWGHLGFLAECTLRTNPIPAVSSWLRAEGVDPVAARDALLDPSAVLWDGQTTWVQLEGHAPDVREEQKTLESLGSFEMVAGPPPRPARRSARTPSALLDLPTEPVGPFVAAIGTGLAWTTEPVAPITVDPGVRAIEARLKAQFDPTGRLNPGRKVGA